MARTSYAALWTIADAFEDAGLKADWEDLISRISDWEVWEEEGKQEDERPTTGPRLTLAECQGMASRHGLKLKKTGTGYTLAPLPGRGAK
jgi:hypothetical protein